MKVHTAIARTLRDCGVDVMFGLMGDANMFSVNAFVRECNGRFVSANHESGAAGMALGYALTTGKVGVCSVTHGPAMTNTVTMLVQGVKASVPMVLIAGDTDTMDIQHTQNVDQREFAKASGAGFVQVRSESSAIDDTITAIRRALIERRPIVLNIPAELDWRDVEYAKKPLQFPNATASVLEGDDIDNAVGIIAAARRPIVLAGRGACSPSAKQALLKLARRIEAPVATTLKAKDLFIDEPENLGIFGTVSTPGAVDAIVQADCIIAFGASLNRYTTSMGSFLKDKRVISVNQIAQDIVRNVSPDVGVLGDPAEVANIFNYWIDEAEIPGSEFANEEFKAALLDKPTTSGAASQEIASDTVPYVTALKWINSVLPQDRVLVTDGGRFMKGAWTMIDAPGPDAFVTTVDFGSIGLGMAHAVGAGVADPNRPVVLATGDGGFMLGGVAEFNSAVRQKLDLIVVIFNDHAYGAEHIKFVARDMDPSMIYFDWPDFASTARGLGGDGCVVRSESDFEAAEALINNRNGPVVIDVRLDPDRMQLD